MSVAYGKEYCLGVIYVLAYLVIYPAETKFQFRQSGNFNN